MAELHWAVHTVSGSIFDELINKGLPSYNPDIRVNELLLTAKDVTYSCGQYAEDEDHPKFVREVFLIMF